MTRYLVSLAQQAPSSSPQQSGGLTTMIIPILLIVGLIYYLSKKVHGRRISLPRGRRLVGWAIVLSAIGAVVLVDSVHHAEIAGRYSEVRKSTNSWFNDCRDQSQLDQMEDAIRTFRRSLWFSDFGEIQGLERDLNVVRNARERQNFLPMLENVAGWPFADTNTVPAAAKFRFVMVSRPPFQSRLDCVVDFELNTLLSREQLATGPEEADVVFVVQVRMHSKGPYTNPNGSHFSIHTQDYYVEVADVKKHRQLMQPLTIKGDDPGDEVEILGIVKGNEVRDPPTAKAVKHQIDQVLGLPQS